MANEPRRQDTRDLEALLDPGLMQQRVWHPQELGAMLEHQWNAPVEPDLEGMPPEQARLLSKLCVADHLVLKSYGDIFTHRLPPIELLELIKEYAKRNMAGTDKELPGDIAKLLYVLSVVVAGLRCGKRITSQSDESVRKSIHSVLAQSWITAPVTSILHDGLEFFGGRTCTSEGGNARDSG